MENGVLLKYTAHAIVSASRLIRWDELQSLQIPPNRQPWTAQEDAFLSTFVNCEGASRWTIVASFLPGRNPKQCRERWHHQLDPSIKREAWSVNEDELLVTLQQKLGNAWSRIAAYLPGRTDNAIKNRWHSARFKARMQHAGYQRLPSGNLTTERQSCLMMPQPRGSGVEAETSFSPVQLSLATSVDDDLTGMWADVAACLLDNPYDGDGHDGE
ncbi:unnamed protein product [Phytophthora fragariaefolia]|uniref:Unnamed protein product n=1 Tax=Phytophthora fragariaefolia TaxID=1490495 RepID=A0A9W6XLP1_9STRA|nr:unnamed protein product [Phytophthora fragariaefolia]